MNWDQIEIKWAEMTSRLQADATKSGIARALDPRALAPRARDRQTPQDQGAAHAQPTPDRDATPEAQGN